MTMRRWLLILIPALIIFLFAALFGSGWFLKQPFGEDDDLLSYVQQLEKSAQQKDWEQAEDESGYAAEAWKKVSTRVQFSVEREYMHEISGVLARIKGGVKAEDDKAILEEIYFFYDLWDNLGE